MRISFLSLIVAAITLFGILFEIINSFKALISFGIFDDCSFTQYPLFEHWVQIDAVFERDVYFDCKDLDYLGGLGQIEKQVFTASSANNSISLVMPPITHEEGYSGYTPANTTEVKITDLWLEQKEYRR